MAKNKKRVTTKNTFKKTESKAMEILKQQQYEGRGKIRDNKFIEDAVLDLIEFVNYISDGKDKVKFYISPRGYQRIEIISGKKIVHWLEDALIPSNPDDYSEIAVAVMTRLRYEVYGELPDSPLYQLHNLN